MSGIARARSLAPAQARPLLILAAIWVVLIAAPFWMPLAGGYTALGSRILVIGLAAMSLNFLIGFTGVVSFGHAAYFGIGVYGAGMILRYVAPSTPLAMIAGLLLGGIVGSAVGALICRRRGIYFALVTIAFQEVFYYIAYKWDSVTGGFDGLRGFQRQPIHFGAFILDIQKGELAFYYFVLAVFAIVVGVMGFILRSPFGRTLLAIRENERRARFLGIPVDRHIWLAFTISPSASPPPARSTRCSTTSPIRPRSTRTSPASSSSCACSAACGASGDRCSAPRCSRSCRTISRASR